MQGAERALSSGVWYLITISVLEGTFSTNVRVYPSSSWKYAAATGCGVSITPQPVAAAYFHL